MKSLIVKKTLWIYFWLKVWLLIFALVGCAPGDQLVFRPDVYITGDFGRYNRQHYYGTYYLYSDIVVKNGTSRHLEIRVNGVEKIDLMPGQEKKISVRVDYRERRDVILTATAFTDSGKIYGTAHKRFSFYGHSYEKRVDIWHIYNWDIRDP